MLEKFVGESLEIIGCLSFYRSHYLREINLNNAKEIGESAFNKTSLNVIKNKHIQHIREY